MKPESRSTLAPSMPEKNHTDKVLRDIYDYASQHLNLQFMLYCSDHSDIPDRRRTPVFDDFGKLRIPMALVTAPAFEKESAEVLSSLRRNASRPFSNDLLFNLLCGLLQVSDNGVPRVLPPELNLCSPLYALTPATTRVLTGTAVVVDDPRYSQSPNN
jgi:heptose-I-phosphate ethanolaminephosphotransferase